MEYRCPHCGNEIDCKWYNTKQKIKCSQCQSLIFKKHEKRLRKMSLILAMISGMLTVTLISFFSSSIFDTISIAVFVSIIMIAISYVVERIICKDLCVNKKCQPTE